MPGTGSLHVTLDAYASWKREKDSGWRNDWELAAARRAQLFDALKSHLTDRPLIELEQRDVEALQQALLADGMPLDDINAAISLLGDACRHAGVKPWAVHPLSTPEEIQEARAHAKQIRDEQLRERAARYESFKSRSTAVRERDGWITLDEARAACVDVLAAIDAGAAIAARTRLETRFLALPGPTAVGGSRLGGAPDGPRDFVWPKRTHDAGEPTPLAFLLQLDLSGVPARSPLPDRGRLLFFYDMEARPWGFDPDDAGGWRVIYDRSDDLVPITPPPDLADEHRYTPARIVFYQVPALAPHWELPSLPDEVSAQYDDLAGALDRFDTRHQILGVPDPHQSHEMECHPPADDWMLLLQLDADYPLGFDLGGRLYFWIRREDLARGNFDRVWTIFQT